MGRGTSPDAEGPMTEKRYEIREGSAIRVCRQCGAQVALTTVSIDGRPHIKTLDLETTTVEEDGREFAYVHDCNLKGLYAHRNMRPHGA